MWIDIKEKDGLKIKIPIPTFLVKIACSSAAEHALKKYMPAKYQKYADTIDFRAFKECVHLLDRYKGLPLAEIKSADGAEIKIIL